VFIKVKNNFILKEIKIILKKKFNITTKITPETILSELKKWDSLMHLDFIMMLEKKFKKKFQLNEMFKIKKISEFEEILRKK
jgi:acyl carrier protein